MDPKTAWKLIPTVMGLGCHVRVGCEDDPYLPNGEPAATNAELVELVVKMAELMGCRVASPERAREILGLSTDQR